MKTLLLYTGAIALAVGGWFAVQEEKMPPCNGNYPFHRWSAWKSTGKVVKPAFGKVGILHERTCRTCGRVDVQKID